MEHVPSPPEINHSMDLSLHTQPSPLAVRGTLTLTLSLEERGVRIVNFADTRVHYRVNGNNWNANCNTIP